MEGVAGASGASPALQHYPPSPSHHAAVPGTSSVVTPDVSVTPPQQQFANGIPGDAHFVATPPTGNKLGQCAADATQNAWYPAPGSREEDLGVPIGLGPPQQKPTLLQMESHGGFIHQQADTAAQKAAAPVAQFDAIQAVAAIRKEPHVERIAPGVDLDAWRGDLHRLHLTLDQVVQSFIGSQTRQLDAVAAELTSQKERIELKEKRFAELSDSIAGFVEEEAQRLEACGIQLNDADVDARREAYDANLPGPPALHRINRMWRKATRAFLGAREAAERDRKAALEEQERLKEAHAEDAERRCSAERAERQAEVADLREQMEALRRLGVDKEQVCKELEGKLGRFEEQLETAARESADLTRRLKEQDAARGRSEYEWSAEREELARERSAAEARVAELEHRVAEAHTREVELTTMCSDRAEKLEQMRRVMDDQEREMTTKIDRVQQYVKERQAGALHAEKKQQDAERMAERWQGEVRRLQAEKDKLAALVLDLETKGNDQGRHIQGVREMHKQEISQLQEALRRKEEEMRVANAELLQRRDEEYQQKVNLERQREKDRSAALLKKKEQDLQIKDQQLRAAKQRLRELENAADDGGNRAQSGSPGICPSPRGGARAGRSTSVSDSSSSLPPLPLSAR